MSARPNLAAAAARALGRVGNPAQPCIVRRSKHHDLIVEMARQAGIGPTLEIAVRKLGEDIGHVSVWRHVNKACMCFRRKR